jgi:lia operon protein LiaF
MRIITGAILILIGLLFLLENTHLFGFEFGEFVSTYWPVALIFIGIVLIYRKAKSDDEEAWKEFVGKEYSKSVGDLKLRPKSINADGLSAKHGLGDLIVDLTDCSLAAGENKLECTLGAGELKVKLPSNIPVKANCSVGAGEIYLLGAHADGIGRTLEHEDEGYSSAPTRLFLKTKVGLGETRVMHP